MTAQTSQDELDDLVLLGTDLAGELAGLLELALTGDPGRHLADFSVTRDAVHHRPGADVSVGFRVRYRPEGAVAGSEQVEEYLVASTAPLEDHPGVAVLASGRHRIAVWRHPGDPRLPGLRAASDPRTVRRWLADAGVPAAATTEVDATAGPTMHMRLRAYRPLRRAVLEYRLGTHRAFAKIVPERRAERLARRHRVVHDAELGAPVLATPAPGVLLLGAASGVPLSTALADPERTPLPRALDVVALLDRLPDQVMELPARSSWTDTLETHARGAAARLPERADEIAALARTLTGARETADAGPLVPTHGDFYEANVFVEGGVLTHLIDLDSVGPGHRVDDLACMLAHIDVLHDLAPDRYAALDDLVREWRDVFAREVDPRALDARTSAVILSLVAGAGHDADARLDRALRWAERTSTV